MNLTKATSPVNVEAPCRHQIERLESQLSALQGELAEAKKQIEIGRVFTISYLTRIQRKKLTDFHKEINSCCLLGCDLYMKTDKGDCKVDMYGRFTWIDELPPPMMTSKLDNWLL